MSFRILDQAPQYLLPSGKVNAGGRLYFYETDLSTPKPTWSDEALTVLNTNPVLMDGAGRTVTDVWGDGEYGVVMADSAGVTIWTRNNVRSDATAGTQIPALQSGYFLTNDGSVLQWQQIVLIPDLTGTNGNILYSDGALPYWAPPPVIPVAPDPEIVVGTASFRAGISTDETKFLIKTGAGSCPASGSTGTNGSVVFDAPFGALWQVYLQAKGGGVTSGGHLPILSVTAQSATGFSVTANVNVLSGGGQSNIINAVQFSWLAIGTVEVAP